MKITFIQTGGTIDKDYPLIKRGYAFEIGDPAIERLLKKLRPSFEYEIISLLKKDSQDITDEDRNQVLSCCKELTNDRIIITHGTDVLHYTAAALAFALEGLGIPVILVGAQRSSDRGSSDASMNLICAAQFIVKSDFAGVALCMHKAMDDKWCGILPATKTRKFHSSRRDTFRVINDKPWAEVSKKGEIKWLKKNYDKRDKNKNLKLKLFKEDLKVGIVKAHPNMYAEELKGYEKMDGLVLEGTGLGHLPVLEYDKYTKENSKILKEIVKLAKKIPVVMTSQTVYGRIDMNVYSAGREILKAGVLGNYNDMITETAFVKLAWLLSNKMNVEENISKNLRGEINKRIEGKEDFLE